MTGSNFDECFCWARGFTPTLLPFLQRTRRNIQHFSKLYLGQTRSTPCLRYFVRFYTTDSCSFTRFHFFDGLKQLVAKLLSTQNLVTHFPIPRESTSGYERVCC